LFACPQIAKRFVSPFAGPVIFFFFAGHIFQKSLSFGFWLPLLFVERKKNPIAHFLTHSTSLLFVRAWGLWPNVVVTKANVAFPVCHLPPFFHFPLFSRSTLFFFFNHLAACGFDFVCICSSSEFSVDLS